MATHDTVSLLFILGVLLIAVVCDVRCQRIPNWLTLPTMALAIVYHAANSGVGGLRLSIGGLFVGIILLLVFYLLGGMGAGDVKLMGAVGGLLGPKGVFIAFLCAALAGGVYAIILLMYRRCLGQTFLRYRLVLKTLLATRKLIYIPPFGEEKKARLFYAIPIAIGTVGSVLVANIPWIQ